MTSTQRCDGIAAIADRFALFLVDQFGVLHDGQQPYPGVVDCLHRVIPARGKWTLQPTVADALRALLARPV